MEGRSMIVGITGPLGGGRTTAARYLGERGFHIVGLSDILRGEARQRDVPNPTIQQLQDLGDELRKGHGQAVLSERALQSAGKRDVVIDGIKNAGEVQELEH